MTAMTSYWAEERATYRIMREPEGHFLQVGPGGGDSRPGPDG